MKLSKEVVENAIEILQNLMEQDAYYINENYFEKKETILQEFLGVLQELYQKWIEKNGSEYPAAFLNFCYLRSSIVTESFELFICLFDKNVYFGDSQVYIVWKPDFIMQQYLVSKKELEKKLYDKILNVASHEIKELQILYGVEYFYFIFLFIKNHISIIIEDDNFGKIEITDDFRITFGGFYEEQVTLFRFDDEFFDDVEDETE